MIVGEYTCAGPVLMKQSYSCMIALLRRAQDHHMRVFLIRTVDWVDGRKEKSPASIFPRNTTLVNTRPPSHMTSIMKAPTHRVNHLQVPCGI